MVILASGAMQRASSETLSNSTQQGRESDSSRTRTRGLAQILGNRDLKIEAHGVVPQRFTER
jgi:hypothetical protein